MSMGLFSQPRPPFWELPPITSTDPGVLYQFGVMCVTRQRHEDMIRTGWTLWTLSGLDQHRAWEFVHDGFRGWREGADPELIPAFLDAVFGRSQDAGPGSTSPGLAATARCWAGMRLLEHAQGDRGALEQRLRDAFSTIPDASWTPEVKAFMSTGR
jgi:hypothetical protein